MGGIISSLARVPGALISLRSVEPCDKAFATGLAAVVLDVLGKMFSITYFFYLYLKKILLLFLAFIPTSVIFGFIIDSACLVWESKCGTTGNCWVYDHDRFRNFLHGTVVFCLVIASFFDLVAIFLADRVKNFYDDDEVEKKIENEKTIQNQDQKVIETSA